MAKKSTPRPVRKIARPSPAAKSKARPKGEAGQEEGIDTRTRAPRERPERATSKPVKRKGGAEKQRRVNRKKKNRRQGARRVRG